LQPTGSLAMYLRAHKKEPFLIPSLLSGLLVALATIIGAKYFGASGVVLGYLFVMGVNLPICIFVFNHCRILWHGKIAPS
jgi:membrane associated rhomboid family serine protease